MSQENNANLQLHGVPIAVGDDVVDVEREERARKKRGGE